jgi:hypothetical protein
LGRAVQKTTNGLKGVTQRLVQDWVVGCYQARSTILSCIARELDADRAGFEATLERLSRGLKRQAVAITQAAHQYLSWACQVARRARFTLLVIDLSEIVKPYGKEMPYLCEVRDGSKSTRTRTVIEQGWWTIEIVATAWDHRVLPLLRRVYSTVHPSFKSVQRELRQALEQVVPRLGQAVWALLDRGFDGVRYFGVLDAFFASWAVRQRGDRHVYLPGKPEAERLSTIAGALRKDQTARPLVVRDDKPVRVEVKLGYCTVEVPIEGSRRKRDQRGGRRRMTLIALDRGPNRPPGMLLISRPVRSAAEARRWVEAYYRRWGVEELAGLEQVRVLSWESIQSVAALSLVTEGLLAIQQLTAPRRAKRLARLAPIDGDVPAFALYRIWLSVSLLLQGRRLGR